MGTQTFDEKKVTNIAPRIVEKLSRQHHQCWVHHSQGDRVQETLEGVISQS